MIFYRDITEAADLPYSEQRAEYYELSTPEISDDPVNSRFSVTLENLQPAHTYEYYVGSKTGDKWSAHHRFTTAPGRGQNFSFVYAGDIQEGVPTVCDMFNEVQTRYPDISFYMVAGDLVNVGSDRNQWDLLMNGMENVWADKMLAPTPGNHDMAGYATDAPRMYFHYFKLPANGPAEMAYGFAYGDAYFFVLDSNDDLMLQKQWLEKELARPEISRYPWKIVMFHHPVYNIKASRQSSKISDIFVPVFDEYSVDLVLNGHDHGYMRSRMLRSNTATADGELGTVYVVANAGTKVYNVEHLRKIAAMTIGGVQTYQIIDIQAGPAGGSTLSYKAYDSEHRLLDEFVITK